jgi:KUP system potassium uptake protein
LATVATVVASQAVISGAFSVVNQGIQLGFLPRLEIRHTSAAARGQIYLPKVNWCLLAAVLVLTVGFGSSEHLGAAYGVAVVGTMALTTLMAALVAVYLWRWPRALVILAFGLLLAVDLAFLVSNTLKIGSGGWAPLLASGVVLGLMWAWVRGRRILYGVLADQGMSIDSLLDLISSSRITRVPGSAVYLARAGENVPHALLHNLKHNKVLHERVLLLTVKTENVPSVPAPERAEFVQLGNGVFRSTLHYGFQETPDVPRDLALLDRPEFPFDPSAVSYMVGRVNVVAGDRPRLPRWQRRVFLIATHNALSAPDFYRLPPNQVVELGAQVSI